PSALRLGLLPVWPPELIPGTDRSRFHGPEVYGLRGTRATPNRPGSPPSAAMRAEGFEPPSSLEHRHLKPACLPVPPRPRGFSILGRSSCFYGCPPPGPLTESLGFGGWACPLGCRVKEEEVIGMTWQLSAAANGLITELLGDEYPEVALGPGELRRSRPATVTRGDVRS